MPQPKQRDRSTSRCDRSKSTHKKQQNKADRHFAHPNQLRSFEQREYSPQQRQKHQPQPLCRKCEGLVRKAKQREDHFKQIVNIYHQEMDKLKEINQSLREQLETLHQEQLQTKQQVEELRRALADCRSVQSVIRDSESVLGKKRQLQLCITPIEKGRQPIPIQRISDKLLSELDSPTFSQLLAGTPHSSHLRAEEKGQSQPEQKENALRMQFDRLMSQCEATSNRSKKTTLRKQMASIANQLSQIGRS